MTPEEQAIYIEKMKAAHDAIMGPMDPGGDEIAQPEPATIDPAEIWGADTQLRSAEDSFASSFPKPASVDPAEIWGTKNPRANADIHQVPRVDIKSQDIPAASDPKWSRETAKALDLSDAMNIGSTSQDPDELTAVGEFGKAANLYASRLNVVIMQLTSMMLEHAQQITAIQDRFNRLR